MSTCFLRKPYLINIVCSFSNLFKCIISIPYLTPFLFFFFFFKGSGAPRDLPFSPTRPFSDLPVDESSSRDHGDVGRLGGAGGVVSGRVLPQFDEHVLYGVLRVGGVTQEPTREGPHQPAVADRKSTRLNSSHLVISYAVFCLKK